MRKLITVIILMCLFLANSQGQHVNSDFETAFTKYTVSAKACTRIVHFSGSLIFIPENAFALSPKDAVDSVDIYYREIRSPLDMIVHDIPMVFSLAGRQVHLESNGMFEIWGKSKDDTLAVHEDKSIEVRLAMSEVQSDRRMEGYRFDASKRSWTSYTNRLTNNRIDHTDDDLWGSSPVQNEEVWEEDDSEWAQEDSIRRVAFQAMEIFDFGLYNYDKIIDDEIFVSVRADFIYKANQKALQATVYIVYDDINSVFYFPPDTWAKGFSIIQDNSYKLFSIDKEGRVARLRDFPLLKEIQDQAFTFQLEGDGAQPENKQELAKLTGLR
jgi:hypothetical protein